MDDRKLKAASTLERDDDVAVELTQFDLSNMATGRICLFGGRAL